MTKEQALQKMEELKKFIEEIDKKPSKEQKLWEIIHSINKPFLKNDEWPDEIFFFRDNTFLFSYDTKNGYLWCSYYNVWKIFEEEHGMKYSEIQSLIKTEVEKIFKLKGVKPEEFSPSDGNVVENTFKVRGITPLNHHFLNSSMVENTFKGG